jgi:hypothetical protein
VHTSNLKWFAELVVRSKTRKFLEEIVTKHFYVWNRFVNRTSKSLKHERKNYKLEFT